MDQKIVIKKEIRTQVNEFSKREASFSAIIQQLSIDRYDVGIAMWDLLRKHYPQIIGDYNVYYNRETNTLTIPDKKEK